MRTAGRRTAAAVTAGALVFAGAVSMEFIGAPQAQAIPPFPITDFQTGSPGSVDPAWSSIRTGNTVGNTITSDGWLRLTDAGTNEATNLLANTAFPSTTGFEVSFDYRQAGGTAYTGGGTNGHTGDGISMYLINGDSKFTAGGPGNGLGYANGAGTGTTCTQPGVTGGYLGLGLDVYGNFASSSKGNSGGNATLLTNGGIGMRGSGPGNCSAAANTQYPWVAGSTTLSGAALWTGTSGSKADPATVTSQYRRVMVRVEPQGSNVQVTVFISPSAVKTNTNPGAMSQVFTANLNSVAGQVALPATLKLGFAASTGGSTDFHDIRAVSVTALTDLSITKSLSTTTPGHDGLPAGTFMAGDPISFTLNATNNGPTAIGNAPDGVARVYDDLSSLPITGVNWTCTASGGATCVTGDGTGSTVSEDWTGPAGSSVRLTVSGTVTAHPGPYTNTAVIPTDFDTNTVDPGSDNVQKDGGLADTNLSNNTATAPFSVVEPHFTQTKTADKTTYNIGDPITYALVVNNDGTGPGTAAVTDVVPDGVAVSSVSCAGTGGATCTAAHDGNNVSGTVTAPAGGSATYKIVGTITGSDATNRATVTPTTPGCDETDADCGGGPVVTPPIDVVGLQVSKTSVPASGAMVAPGKPITYTITAKNLGNADLNPVTLTDDLSGVLANATMTGAPTATGGGTLNGPTAPSNTLTWTGAIPAGQTVTVTYTVTVNANVTAGTTFTNHVVSKAVNPKDPNTDVATSCVTGTETGCGTTVTAGVPELIVKKTSNPANGAQVVPGQTITYQLTAQNKGNTDLNPVTLTDDLSGVLAHATLTAQPMATITGGGSVAAASMSSDGKTVQWSGDIPTGQTVTVTYTVTVSTAVTAANTFTNKVIGKGVNPDVPDEQVPSTCTTGTEDGCSSTVTPAVPHLSVSKSSVPANGAQVVPGQTITYTLTGYNDGNTDLNPVTLTDDLSAVLAHATLTGTPKATLSNGASAAAPSVAGTTLTWAGDVPAGQTVTVTYTVTVNANVTAADKLVNNVVGTGVNPDYPGEDVPSTCQTGAESGCSSTVTPAVPDFTVSKSSVPATGAQVTPGQTITYTLTGHNDGNTDLRPATLTDNLSGVLAHATLNTASLKATLSNGAAAAAPALGAVGHTLAWSGDVPAGQTVTVTYTVTVDADATAADTLVNHVIGTGTNPDYPSQNVPSTCQTGTEAGCTSTVTPAAPHLSVSKTSTPASGTQVAPGRTVTYTLTAKNDGNTDLNPVTLTDDLSKVTPYATIDPASFLATVNNTVVAPPALSADGNTLTWAGDVPAGQEAVITYSAVVNQDVPAGAQLANAVTGTGENPNDPGQDVPSTCTAGTDAGCSSTVTVDVPALDVQKTSTPASGSQVTPGQTITYKLVAKNSGNTNLSPVTMTDDLSGVLAHATLNGAPTATITGGATVNAPSVSASHVVTWTGDIAAGQTVTVTYQVTVASGVTATDVLVNKVIASGENPNIPGQDVPSTCATGTEPGCFSTLTPGAPKLTVSKTSVPATGSPVLPGQAIQYKLTGTNSGNTDLKPVTLTDDLSDVLASATMVPGSLTATVNGQSATAPSVSSANVLTWSGEVPAGQSVVVAYSVVVNDDVSGDATLANHVTGTGTNPNDPGQDVPSTCATGAEAGCSSTLTPQVPHLSISKKSDPASGSQVSAGQKVTYTLTAVNDGNTDLNPVTLTDDLSNVLKHATLSGTPVATISGGQSAPNPTMANGTLTWAGDVPAGQTVTVVYAVVVNADVTSSDLLVNDVTGTGTNPGAPGQDVPSTCENGTDAGCSSTLTPGVPALTVTKTSNPVTGAQVAPGQTVTYTLKATNSGNTDLNPVTLTDDLSGVLAHATLTGTPTASVTGGGSAPAPTISSDSATLTWAGDVPAGQTVTVTYAVVVNADVTPADVMTNHVVGTGENPNDPGQDVPSTCQDGTGAGCTSVLTPALPGLVVTKTSDPVSGSQVAPGQTVTYTVTAHNSGNTELNPVIVTDDLSNVLAHATLVGGSLAASIAGQPANAPTVSSDNVLTWTGDLPVNATVTIVYQVTVNQDVTKDDVIANNVTGSGASPDNPGEDVPSTCVSGDEPGCSSILTPAEPDLSVTKTSDPVSGSQVAPGDVVTYTLTGVNDGNTDLNPVTLTDNLSDVLAHSQMVAGSMSATVNGHAAGTPQVTGTVLTWAGDVPAGQSVVVTYRVTVDQDATPADVLTNHVVGTGTNPDYPDEPVPSPCEDGTGADCTSVLTPGVPHLSVTKTSVPATGSQVAPGQTVAYTLKATNDGNTDLNPVTLTDDLSGVLAHATLVSGSPKAMIGTQQASAPALSSDGQTLTWAGDLQPGQTVTVTYAVTANDKLAQGDTITNHVTATGKNPDDPGQDVPSTCTAGVEDSCTSILTPSLPGLSIAKTSNPVSGSQVAPGQKVTYTLTATNTGNTDLNPVTLTDDLSGVLAHATLTGTPTATMSNGQTPPAPSVASNTLTWAGDVPAEQTVTVVYSVTVAQDVTKADILANSVTGKGENPDNPGEDVPSTCENGTDAGCSSTLTPSEPGLAMSKTSDPASGSQVAPGEVVTYTITARNTGNTDLNPVTVTDDLTNVLAHTTLVAGSLSATVNGAKATVPTIAKNTLTWVGDVPMGQTATITYQVTVNDGLSSTDHLVNAVTGTGENPDNPGQDVPSTCENGGEMGCSSDLTPSTPSLSVTKTSNPKSGSHVAPGQLITYALTGKNTGNTDLDPVTLTDNLAGVLAHATVVKSSLKATLGGQQAAAPTLSSSNVLTWAGEVPAGESVIVTYQVIVNQNVTPSNTFVNKVTGTGKNPDNPGEDVPSTCTSGAEESCSSTLLVEEPPIGAATDEPPVIGVATGGSVQSGGMAFGQLVAMALLVIASGVAWLSYRRRANC